MRIALRPLLFAECQRRPYFRVFGWEVEPWRHYSHHHVLLAVDLDIAADEAVITAEPALPQSVTQKRDPRAAGAVLLRQERPAERGLDSEQREQVPAGGIAVHFLRVAFAGQAVRSPGHRSHVGENAVLLLPIDKVGGGGRVLRETHVAGVLPDHGQPVGIVIGQWTQQHGFHDAEHSGVRADAQRHEDHSDCAKGGALPEHSPAVLHVFQ